MTYHPDLKAGARWVPRGLGRRWALPLLRWLFRVAGARATEADEEVVLDGCSVFVYRPQDAGADPRPALLWIHGGGLVMGDARQDDAFLRRLVD